MKLSNEWKIVILLPNLFYGIEQNTVTPKQHSFSWKIFRLWENNGRVQRFAQFLDVSSKYIGLINWGSFSSLHFNVQLGTDTIKKAWWCSNKNIRYYNSFSFDRYHISFRITHNMMNHFKKKFDQQMSL